MKRFILFSLLALPFSAYCCEESIHNKQEQEEFDLEGKFTLVNYGIPVYAGYGQENNPYDPYTICKNQLNRNIEPNELLFDIIGLIHIQNEDTINPSILMPKQKKEWSDLVPLKVIPFNEANNLNEGNSLFFKTHENKKVKMVVDTKAFTKDTNMTFAKILKAQLKKAKNLPNYFSSERNQLIKDQILTPKEKEPGYVHGPNGFNFSLLDNKN